MNKYNNNKFRDLLKKKGFYISLMAGAICVVAFTAVYMNSASGENSKELRIDGSSDFADNGEGHSRVTELGIEEETASALPVDKNKINVTDNTGETDVPDSTTQATTAPSENKADEDKMDNQEKNTDNKKDKNKDKNKDKSDENQETAEADAKVAVMKSGDGVSNLSFNQEKGIMWPVKGDIVMNYSPDSVVYYKSLGVYKTNPALIISATEGANVCSGTDAVVTDIGENEEIGKYVITSIGDGYKIIYGQLDNIQTEQGAKLKEGEIIGTVAAPTKYYIEEGSNLYLKMICEDQPVDPLIFLR